MGCGSATNNDIAVTVLVVAGQGYTIRIGSNANGTVGAGEISFTCVTGPTCDSIDFNNGDQPLTPSISTRLPELPTAKVPMSR